MTNKIEYDPKEFDANYTFLKKEYKKTNYFKNALANLTVILAFIGFMIMIFGASYLGVMGFNKQMDLIECVDYQNLSENGGVVSEEVIYKCGKIGVEIKN